MSGTQYGPGPHWNIQPTTLYFVCHYPTNGVNEAPDHIDPIMYDRKGAEARAVLLLGTIYTNTGVCTITPTTSDVLYPATFFDASAPN